MGEKIGGGASSQAIIQERKDKSVDDMVSVKGLRQAEPEVQASTSGTKRK